MRRGRRAARPGCRRSCHCDVERSPMSEEEQMFAVAICLREIRGSTTDEGGHRDAEDADTLLALLRRRGLRLVAEGSAPAAPEQAVEPAGAYRFCRGLHRLSA